MTEFDFLDSLNRVLLSDRENREQEALSLISVRQKHLRHAERLGMTEPYQELLQSIQEVLVINGTRGVYHRVYEAACYLWGKEQVDKGLPPDQLARFIKDKIDEFTEHLQYAVDNGLRGSVAVEAAIDLCKRGN